MAKTDNRRIDWFRKAGWGLFTHYIAELFCEDISSLSPEEWNRIIDGFDVPGLAAQLKETRTNYFCITLGQNSGFYCSPNETYDGLVKRSPSRLSKRDLVTDVAAALEPLGIRTMVYFTCHAPAKDPLAVAGLACTPPWDASRWQLLPGTYLNTNEVDKNLTEFHHNWEAVIREWSLRWGTRVHGWWIDGCYFTDHIHQPESSCLEGLAQAMRAGNPESIVAFNPGVKNPVISMTASEDYTAGEIAGDFPISNYEWRPGGPIEGFVGNAQYHVLTYLGDNWSKGEPRISKELLAAYTNHVRSLQGVITWDIPTLRNGLIPEQFVEMLKYLGAQMR